MKSETSSRRILELFASFRHAIEPLWTSGLCLLLVLSGMLFWRSSWIGLRGETYEWVQYLVLGTVFPFLLLCLCSTWRQMPRIAAISDAVKFLLAFTCFLTLIVIVIQKLYYDLFVLALIQFIVTTNLANHRRPLSVEALTKKPITAITHFLVITASWLAGLHLIFWEWPDIWAFGSHYAMGVFAVSWLLVIFVLFSPQREKKTSTTWHSPLNLVVTGTILVIIGLASVRTDSLFTEIHFSQGVMPVAFHHWGVYLGPVAMVRQGGWLLWDVPAQYGFLSTLSLSWFPAHNVWQSLYTVNAFLLFVSTTFLFFLLRVQRSGIASQCFALGVVLGAVHFVTAYPEIVAGPHLLPSIGPLRFIWCYALLAVLVWEFHWQANARRRKLTLITGSACWLIGSLWSMESAAYCACIWLPAYAILTLQYIRETHSTLLENSRPKLAIGRFALWAMLPSALLILAIGTIDLYYLLRLGHGPDWNSFVEYALYTKATVWAAPVDPQGSVWALLLLLCGLSTGAIYAMGKRSQRNDAEGTKIRRTRGIMIGAWWTVWATSSYYVSRSTELNLINLSPIFVATIAVVLYSLREHKNSNWTFLIKSVFVPLLSLWIAAIFINPSKLAGTLAAWRQGYATDITQRLPRMDRKMVEILQVAHVKADDPLVFLAPNLLYAAPPSTGDHLELSTPPRTWLPTMPFALIGPLREDRQVLYMQRFTQRAHLSGWLLQYRDGRSYWYPGLPRQLIKTHAPVKMFENDEYQLIWLKYRDLPVQ